MIQKFTMTDKSERHFPNVEIVPFEQICLPPELDGSLQLRSQLDWMGQKVPKNDIDAISKWLDESGSNPKTFISYRSAAERCLLWATSELAKPLSALDKKDFEIYIKFLSNPQPSSKWISSGTPRRSEPSWRPFRTLISPRSRDHSMVVLSGLFAWMRNHRYIDENPFYNLVFAKRGHVRREQAAMTVPATRANVITSVEWKYIKKVLCDLSDTSADCRLNVIFYLAYFADLKPNILSSLTVDSIEVLRTSASNPVWALKFTETDSDTKKKYLLPPVQKVLSSYLNTRGLCLADTKNLNKFALIESLTDKLQDHASLPKNITVGALYTATKDVFIKASALAANDGDLAATVRLRRASINWLVHAFEVHSYHFEDSGCWAWLLLGAKWRASNSTYQYLPDRGKIKLKDIRLGFKELEPMWKDH